MKLLGIAALGLLLSFFAPEAKSQTWVICESCQTISDFEQVAVDQSPPVPNSWYMYAVGNPSTGIFRYVEVSTYREGEVPAMVYPSPKRNARMKDGSGASASYYDPSLRYSVVSVPAGDDERRIFVSIAKMNTDEVVAPPPGSAYGFDSFAGADLVAVGKYLWAFKTALDPNWTNEALGNGSWTGLWEAFKMLRGQGPTACLVFRNGDSACYQLNPMDPNAPRHIDGTAKNIYGQLLDSSSSSGGSIGDGDPLILVHSNTNEYRWTNGSNTWLWLICSSQGGVLQNCYYVIM